MTLQAPTLYDAVVSLTMACDSPRWQMKRLAAWVFESLLPEGGKVHRMLRQTVER